MTAKLLLKFAVPAATAIAVGFLLVVMVLMSLFGGEKKDGAAITVTDDDKCTDAQLVAAKKSTKAGTINVPAKFKDDVKKAAKVSGIPEEILAAQINAESNFNEKASSGVANGLTQFTPATWKSYGNGKSVWDGHAAIDAQGRYMRDLMDQVKPVAKTDTDRIRFALAAYNAGPGNVTKYNGIPPFEETQNYVTKIMGGAQVKFSSTCKPAAQPASLKLGKGEWTSPLPGSHLTSGYGSRPCPLSSCAGQPYLMFHEGIDLAGGNKEYFYAPTDMKITYVGLGPIDKNWAYYGEYIYAVQVDEPHLVFEFHEAAQGSLKVKKGQTVKAGTALGKPGATGNSSGIHVHFQVNKPGTDVSGPTIQNGKSIDPMPFLREKGVAP